MRLVDVRPDNVERTGFFCKMSQPKSEGYRRKLAWLEARFGEGLRIKMLDLAEGGRGFIEYIPGEYAWRPVEAAGYSFIHCLWVVGKSKGQGHASRLLDACLDDARRDKRKGVAMLTSEGNWLLSRKFLARRGFEPVAEAPPSFTLMVHKFGRATPPALPSDWEARARRFGEGLTVVRTDQCPYLDDAVRTALGEAKRRGMRSRVVELESASEVRRRAPTPYGVFAILRDGELVTHHYQLEKQLVKLLDARSSGYSRNQ